MTTANAFDGKPPTLNDAMLFYRFDGVLRACGSIPTPRRKKWRQAVAVKIYRKKDNKLKNLFHKPVVYKSVPEASESVGGIDTGATVIILSIKRCKATFIFLSTATKSSSSSDT